MDFQQSEQHWEKLDKAIGFTSTTPEMFWNAAKEYFRWMDNNPIRSKITIKTGKETGRIVIEEKPRAYSVKALCAHCGMMEEVLRDIRQGNDKTSLWYIVVSKVLYLIYIQNFELASVEVFNPVFISKALNMEKDDVPTSSVKVIIETATPTLAKSENEILEKLEYEYEKVEIPKDKKG